uniref:parthenolide synthase-like n=1 Tax=Erigeron canadensis TaxID=72917 RepID=UPI001CB98781|nr:parthenolide synthase-like [Erigeron canadensis]
MDVLILSPSWLLAIIFMSLILTYIRKSNKSSAKLPPSPPRLPIIGNLHQLVGKPRPQALWDLAQEYGPIVQLQIGAKPYILVSSPSMAKQILKTHDHIFCSRPISNAAKRLTYEYLDIAFSPQSDHRKEKRKILVSEFLAPKKARSFNRVLVMEIENMVRSLSSLPSNTKVNVSKILLELVKEVVCKVGFGKNYKEIPLSGGSSWEEILEETSLMLNGSFSDNFPWIGQVFDRLSGWNSKLEKCFGNLDAFIQMIVDDHLINNHKDGEISDANKDFVHRMIAISSFENASDYQLTKEDVKALIMNVFTGGIDTTVSALEWAMSEIVKSPRVLKKLQDEIRNCMGRKQKVDELDITKMTYLKLVVKETLRLHPPAPLLVPHECFSQCQIGGYDVFPGTSAIINAWGIGRDRNTWGENADEFYPERFEKLDADFGGGNFELVAFGAGRRSCPAISTAPATVEWVIANLLYWFDWEFDGGVKNEDLDMQEEGTLIVHKKLPLYLIPTKHSWED